jgi:NADPH:quinone reductase-like Zn-dependent oxidoreductase
VGSFAVQIARALGARVTGVCSTKNLDLVRSIGAQTAIDYTQEDFTQCGARYDLVFDVAAKRSFPACRSVLGPQGVYVTTAFSPALALQGLWRSWTGRQRMAPVLPRPPSQQDLIALGELLETGKVTPVIDQCYTLREVPDALRYLGTGHARGKVVISV